MVCARFYFILGGDFPGTLLHMASVVSHISGTHDGASMIPASVSLFGGSFSQKVFANGWIKYSPSIFVSLSDGFSCIWP